MRSIIFIACNFLLFLCPLLWAHGGNKYIIRAVIQLDREEIRSEVYLSGDLLRMMIEGLPVLSREDVQPIDDPKLLQKIENFFKEKNPTHVDGIRIHPVLQEAETGLTMRLVFVYPVKKEIGEYKVHWDVYPFDVLPKNMVRDLISVNSAHNELMQDLKKSDQAKLLDVMALSAVNVVFKAVNEPPQEITLRKVVPEFTWQNSRQQISSLRVSPVDPWQLHIPLYSVAGLSLLIAMLFWLRSRSPRKHWQWISTVFSMTIVASSFAFLDVEQLHLDLPSRTTLAMPDDYHARYIFRTLHQNIYRAFDYSDKSDIYDVLAQSVSGDLLVDIYREIYGNLLVRNDEGRQCLIKSVKIEDSEVVARDFAKHSFRIKCRWLVEGYVIHSDHTHIRTNEYAAIYDIGAVDGAWKIIRSQVLQQIRRQAE